MKSQSVILLLLLFAFAGCKEKETSDNSALDANKFAEQISRPSEKIILDVRTPEEFNEGHIQNAMLINFLGEDFKQQVSKLDKEIPVYVYCASGVRSEKAATVLKGEGFKEIYVLKEGLKEWRKSNHELVK
jgi:rhodanese-related sulfurtransferase